jgi:hypothetical protein
MGQYLLIPFLVGWTSIYQLFWCSPGVQGFDPSPYLNGDIAIRKESSIPIISTCMWLKRCLTGRLGWSQAELLKTSMQGIQYAAICCILLNSLLMSLVILAQTRLGMFGRPWQPKWKPQQPNFIFIRQNWSLSGASFSLVPPSFPAPWHILTQSPTMSDLSQQSVNAQSQTQALPPCGPAGNTDKHSRNQPSYISLLLYILLSDCQWILGAPSSKTWGIKGGPSTQVDRSMVQIKPTSRIENWTSRSGLLIGMVELKPVAHSCQFWAVFGMHVEIRWNTYVCHIMCRRTKVQADYLSTLPAAPRCWFFVSAAPDEFTITRCHPFVMRYEYPQNQLADVVFWRWVKTVNSHAIIDKFPLQVVNQQKLWFF